MVVREMVACVTVGRVHNLSMMRLLIAHDGGRVMSKEGACPCAGRTLSLVPATSSTEKLRWGDPAVAGGRDVRRGPACRLPDSFLLFALTRGFVRSIYQ